MRHADSGALAKSEIPGRSGNGYSGQQGSIVERRRAVTEGFVMAFDVIYQSAGAKRSRAQGFVEPVGPEGFALRVRSFRNSVGVEKQGIAWIQADFNFSPGIVGQDTQWKSARSID